MPFLQRIELTRPTGTAGYPFSVPSLAMLDVLHFPAPVTFFVGENGSGKSTLLGFPKADILSFDEGAIRKADYASLPHVTLTRDFLADPARYTRRL